MKRFKIYLITSIFIISTILPLTSCASKKETSTESTVVTNESTDNQKNDTKQELAESSSSNTESKNSNASSVKSSITETENKLNNQIAYPVFNNISNQDKVNNLILNHVKKIKDFYSEDAGIELDIKYKTTFKNEKYISIYFSGNIKDNGAPYPSIFKSTLNINIETARIMTLNDIANINEKLINEVNKGIESEFKKLGTEVLESYKGDNLKALLKQADKNEEYLPDVQTYFTDNETVIVLSVIHALGDYMEIHIKNNSIESYIVY